MDSSFNLASGNVIIHISHRRTRSTSAPLSVCRLGQVLLIVAMMVLNLPSVAQVVSAVGESKTSLQRLERLFPTNDASASWQQAGESYVFEGDQLFDYINGGAEPFHEYGFVRVMTQEYEDGDNTLTVDIYQMTDAGAAFGIYSIQREPDQPLFPFGDGGSVFDFHVSFWQDHYYVILTGSTTIDNNKDIVERIAKYISDQIPDRSGMPAVVHRLPEQNRLTGSEGYIRGFLGMNTQLYLGQDDVLGFDQQQVEGAFASYEANGGSARLAAIAYNQIEGATERVDHLKDLFSEKYSCHQDCSYFRDDRDRYYGAWSVNDTIYIVFRSSSPELIQLLAGLTGADSIH